MSNGQKSDWAETQRQLIEPCPVIGGKTWLRHKSDSQAGLIDLRLLEGNYSVEDIASELNEIFLPTKPIGGRVRRVLDHIEHLQHGDTKGNISGVKPHELKLNEILGKWCFVAK
jgi:hypothetical protein